MILVTRFNLQSYYLNPLLVETVEATPDTMITLVTGKKLLIKETPEEVIQRINEFYGRITFASLPSRLISHSLSEGELE